MQTLKKTPGKALESETAQGGFYTDTAEQPNPGYYKMEIFKDIPGFEGKYQASNLGRIKSLKRYIRYSKGGKEIVNERILKQSMARGYCMVFLGNKRNHFSVHRLVGLVFIPNLGNKPEINHKNGITDDNRIENLEWVTRSENMLHSYRVLGLISSKRKPVAQYDLNGKLINIFKSAAAAAKFINRDRANISGNCRGKTKTCYGYKFKYI